MSNDATSLTAWLSDLEKEVAEKVVLIAGIRQKLGLDPAAPISPLVPPTAGAAGSGSNGTWNGSIASIRSDEFYRMTLPDAIKKFLDMAKRPQGPKTIADAMKQGGILSNSGNFKVMVASTLKRMRSRDILVNNQEGWGLADWYKGRGKAPDPPPSRRPAKKAANKKLRVWTPAKAASAAKKPSPPSAAGRKNPASAFVGEKIKSGMSMKDAWAAWREQKAKG